MRPTSVRPRPARPPPPSSGWTGCRSARLGAVDARRDPRRPTPDPPRGHPATELDPGWTLARLRTTGPVDPPAIVADHPWWPRRSTESGAQALGRLWRHASVSLAARSLAREANDPDPEPARPRGALASAWPLGARRGRSRAARLLAGDAGARAATRPRGPLAGLDVDALGRTLAARWGCGPLVADAAWLHADLAADLGRLFRSSRAAGPDPARPTPGPR